LEGSKSSSDVASAIDSWSWKQWVVGGWKADTNHSSFKEFICEDEGEGVYG